MTPVDDAPPDMEYAHPGAPDRYTPRNMPDFYAQPGALSMEIYAPPARGDYDLRTVDQRRHDEISELMRQMSRISQLTITLAADVRRLKESAGRHASEIAELRTRLDRQEATD